MKNFLDKITDFVLTILKPFLRLAVRLTFDIETSGYKINKKREPFILIGNHVTTWDAFIVSYDINYPIRFLATEISFLDFGKRITMGWLARTIKKRVGKSDTLAMRQMLSYIEKGYAIGFFPEGDDTFDGETLDIYSNTGRFLKLCNLDIILVKSKGTHLHNPRWADNHAKRKKIFTETEILLTKEDLKSLSAEEVKLKVEKAIYHNDYEWQRQNMINYARKNKAEGIERLIYYCNKCGSVLSVFGNGSNIECRKCGVIGRINDYGFIEDNKFDNLVDYNKDQYKHIEEVIKSEFSFDITLNIIDFKKVKNIKQGKYKLKYKDKELLLYGEKDFIFKFENIKYPTKTMKNSFSFDYDEISYNITDCRHINVLYEINRYLNGSYK
ncbi:1-acyl-sn-glycerol-3-phosphate acyltransferase [Mycoplasmatota bacterium]|nr:1-acyl-sn-glycerol-3-phosphate acyltransferase [Mycoplasmatota bacterium]